MRLTISSRENERGREKEKEVKEEGRREGEGEREVGTGSRKQWQKGTSGDPGPPSFTHIDKLRV